MESIILILAIVALVLGIVGVVESKPAGYRNWAAWGVIALAALHIYAAIPK